MAIQEQIDRTLDEPAYSQLAAILQKQIFRGIYRSGDRLPSESQLRKTYKVSPMTVRRTITMLVEKGVVWTSQGLGTFVSSLKMHNVTFSLEDIYKTLNSNGTTQVKILRASIIKADEKIAPLLHTKAGTNTIYICRLLIKDDTPLIYHREYFIYDPCRPIVETELQIASLHDLFSGNNESDLKRGDFTISTAVLTDEDAGALDSRPGSTAFHLEHRFFDYDENPISFGVFICRGDKFKFHTSIGKGLA
jgi:GntR family transcriptional regulator